MRNYTITTANSVFTIQNIVNISRSMGMMEFFVNYGDNSLPILILPEQEIISIEAPQQPSQPNAGTFSGAVDHRDFTVRTGPNTGMTIRQQPVQPWDSTEQPF